jgi:pilus assembly protein CpaF
MSEPNGPSEKDTDYSDRLVEDRFGNRQFTLDALREQAVTQFLEETFDRVDILSELDTPKKQREAVAETTDYVLAIENVWVTAEERKWIVDSVYRDIFRFGALDSALHDDTVSEISINKPREVFVRRGFGELVPFEEPFLNAAHLAQVLAYALMPIGVRLEESDPFLEIGLTMSGRPMRLSLVGPPMAFHYSGQIRLHPSQPIGIDVLKDSVIPTVALDLVKAIISGGHGLLIVGEGGVGKTTLLANLLKFVSDNAKSGLVQRAFEIHSTKIPEHMTDYTALPKTEPATDVFERQINVALDDGVSALFIDEIHGDEGAAFWRVLTERDQLQCVATFRGKANIPRLHSGISMAIRKTHRALPQEDIDRAFLERLPFVLVVSRPNTASNPRMTLLGQWTQSKGEMNLEPLVTWDDVDEPSRTAIQPIRDLNL